MSFGGFLRCIAVVAVIFQRGRERHPSSISVKGGISVRPAPDRILPPKRRHQGRVLELFTRQLRRSARVEARHRRPRSV